MPVARAKSSNSQTRINNNRLCPKANDILKQVQALRKKRGRTLSLRDLNDEAVIEYFANELSAPEIPKPSSRKSAAA